MVKKIKYATPMKAIRLKCIDCCGWQNKEVKLCPHKNCAIHHLRGGRKQRGIEYSPLTLAEYRKRFE